MAKLPSDTFLSLSSSWLYFGFCRISFWRHILFIWMSHVSLFLYVSCKFVLGSAYLKKTATSHNWYGLALCRERLSPVSLARDYRGFLNLSCGWVFPGLGYVNSQCEEFADSFFQKLVISCSLLCLSIVSQVLWSCCKLSSFLLFSAAPKASRICQVPSVLQICETETDSSGSPLKS